MNTVTKCPICACKSTFFYTTKAVHKTKGYLHHLKTFQESSKVPAIVEPYYFCDSCGFTYHPQELSTPAVTPVAEAVPLTDMSIGLERHILERSKGRLAGRNNWISNFVRPGYNTLDVGSQYGILVNFLQSLGCDAIGVEPNFPTMNIGKTHFGINVINDYYTKEIFPEKSFDFIFSFSDFFLSAPSQKSESE